MKKKSAASAICFLLFSFMLASCSKEDRFTKKLSRGEGVWLIDKVMIQQFDSTGATTLDSTIYNIGEMVFMRSESHDALYDYRQAVFLITDTAGTHGYFFEYMFDGSRVNIQLCQAPFAINGTYTSVIDKPREKQWEIYGTNSNTNAVTSLTWKFILHLTRKND